MTDQPPPPVTQASESAALPDSAQTFRPYCGTPDAADLIWLEQTEALMLADDGGTLVWKTILDRLSADPDGAIAAKLTSLRKQLDVDLPPEVVTIKGQPRFGSASIELGSTIARALNAVKSEEWDAAGYADIDDIEDATLDSRFDLVAVADALIADGWSKNQPVETPEQLETLPSGSVVTWVSDGHRRSSVIGDNQHVELPATVVFTPAAQS